MKALELFKLIGIKLWVATQNLIEYLKVVWCYYRNPLFRKVDLALLWSYFCNNPYRISRDFLLRRGEANIYAYGETPLTTLEQIVKEAGIGAEDTVFELGSGRGRPCFWLRCFVGCNVIGIEFVPDFVAKANEVRQRFKLSGIDFRHQDMLKADLSGASVVYLYGTCMEDLEIHKLIDQLEKLPEGTKIITVSYPLTDFTDKEFLVVERIFPAKFTWGMADVYLQRRKGTSC
jgi:hypothetical protein